MGGFERKGEAEDSDSNPVQTGLSVVDNAHLSAEAALDGGTSARSWAEMAGHMGHEAEELIEGKGSAAARALRGATALASPLAIAGGIWEMIDGVKELTAGNSQGLATAIGGGAGAASGVAGMAGLAGVPGALPLAPALAAGATGVKVGEYGDNEAKKLGLFHDQEGKPETISEWAGNNGKAADAWVTKHLHSGALGTIAGLGATLGSSLLGAPIAVDSALVGAALGGYSAASHVGHALTGAGHAIGTGLANHHRTSTYKGWDVGLDEKGAQEMADYDDLQRAAVARADAARKAPKYTSAQVWAQFQKAAGSPPRK